MPPKSGTTKRNPFPTRSSEVEPEAAINGGPKPAVGSWIPRKDAFPAPTQHPADIRRETAYRVPIRP